jgi:hypothetical protein
MMRHSHSHSPRAPDTCTRDTSPRRSRAPDTREPVSVPASARTRAPVSDSPRAQPYAKLFPLTKFLAKFSARPNFPPNFSPNPKFPPNFHGAGHQGGHGASYSATPPRAGRAFPYGNKADLRADIASECSRAGM